VKSALLFAMVLSLVTLLGLLQVQPAGAGDKACLDLCGDEICRCGNTFTQSTDVLFDVHPGGALWLGTTNGSVRINTWAKEKIRVVVTKTTQSSNSSSAVSILEDFVVQASHRGDDLNLKGRGKTESCDRSVGVTFTVWVPQNYNVAVETGRGSIDIGKLNGKFSARTLEGKITLECDPDAGLDIEVEDRTGSVPPAAPAGVVGAGGFEGGLRR
jgi:hypothetical protein